MLQSTVDYYDIGGATHIHMLMLLMISHVRRNDEYGLKKPINMLIDCRNVDALCA